MGSFSIIDAHGTPIDPAATAALLVMLKEFMGITDSTNDQELSDAIDMSISIIETYLDRAVVKRLVEDHYVAHFGTVALHHPQVDVLTDPIVTLNGIEQDGYSIYLDRAKQAYLTRTGVPYDMPFDWRKYDQVNVTYMAGYDPIPPDLSYGIVIFAAMIYNAQGSGVAPTSASSATKQFQLYDVGQVTYDTGASEATVISYQSGLIPSNIAGTLYPYMRISA